MSFVLGDRDSHSKEERTGEGGGRYASWWQWAELDQGETVVLPDTRGQDLGTEPLSPSPRKEKRMSRQDSQPGRTRVSVRRPDRHSAPEEQAWSMVAQEDSHREQKRIHCCQQDRKSHPADVLKSLHLWPRLLWSH